MKLKTTLTLLLLSVSITRCLPNKLWVQYTPLKTLGCSEKSKAFYLFFENETADFQYQKLGIVEIETSGYYSTQTILAHLQEIAWLNCANAVINVKESHYSKDEWNNVLDSYVSTYYVKYTAVAAFINSNSQFLTKYGNESSLAFLDYLDAYRRNKSRLANNKQGSSGCMTVIMASALVLFILNIVAY